MKHRSKIYHCYAKIERAKLSKSLGSAKLALQRFRVWLYPTPPNPTP